MSRTHIRTVPTDCKPARDNQTAIKQRSQLGHNSRKFTRQNTHHVLSLFCIAGHCVRRLLHHWVKDARGHSVTLRPLHRVSAHLQLKLKQAVKDLFRAMFSKQGSAKACQEFRETLIKASAIRIVVLIILGTCCYRNVKIYEIILKIGIYIFEGNAAERNRCITLVLSYNKTKQVH
jgi:hypothetical protein